MTEVQDVDRCVKCGEAIAYAKYSAPINSGHWYHVATKLVGCMISGMATHRSELSVSTPTPSPSVSEAAAPSTVEFRAMLAEADNEVTRLKQAIGWILDAADAAYIEDENNERVHEIFNIAAKASGITRRLPDENHPFEL